MLMKQLVRNAAVALTLALSAFANQSAAADFVDFKRPAQFIETDVHVLGGINTLVQNYQSKFPQIQNLNMNMGASLGVGARAVFGIRGYLGVGTAIDLTVNNNNMDMAIVGSDQLSMSSVFIDNRTYQVTVPVFMSFRFNVDRSVRWNIDLGMYYAYGFAGKQKQRIYRAEINEMDELVPQRVDIKTDYYHSPSTFINSFNRGDIGLHLGTSLNFGPHLFVGLQFRVGAKNSARKSGVVNPSVHNLNFHGVLGYRF